MVRVLSEAGMLGVSRKALVNQINVHLENKYTEKEVEDLLRGAFELESRKLVRLVAKFRKNEAKRFKIKNGVKCKRCRKCKKWLPVNHFNLQAARELEPTEQSIQAWCKACMVSNERVWSEENVSHDVGENHFKEEIDNTWKLKRAQRRAREVKE